MGSNPVESPEFFRFMRQLLKIVQQVRGSYLQLILFFFFFKYLVWIMNGVKKKPLQLLSGPESYILESAPAVHIFMSGPWVQTAPKFPTLAIYQAFCNSLKSVESKGKCKYFRQSQTIFDFSWICVALLWRSLLNFISSRALLFR